MQKYEEGQRLKNTQTGEIVTIEKITIEQSPVGEVLCFHLKSNQVDALGNPSYYHVTQVTLEAHFTIT